MRHHRNVRVSTAVLVLRMAGAKTAFQLINFFFFFFQAEDGIRDPLVTGVQTCALPICSTSHEPQDPLHDESVNRINREVTRSALGGVSATTTMAPKKFNPARSLKPGRSEEQTSELQSRVDLVCRLLLEKKKQTTKNYIP